MDGGVPAAVIWADICPGETAAEVRHRSWRALLPSLCSLPRPPTPRHHGQLAREVFPPRQQQHATARRLLGAAGVRRGEVVELYGADGAGKTEVLLELVVATILPKTWLNAPCRAARGDSDSGGGAGATDAAVVAERVAVTVGGDEATAVVLDVDGRFSAARLAQLLHGRLSAAGVPESALPAAIHGCLARVLVAHPPTVAAAAALLAALPSLAPRLPGLALVAVDSVAGSHYGDRAAGGDRPAVQDAPMVALAAAVAALRAGLPSRAPAVVVTKPALYGGGGDTGTAAHREYLPKAWAALVTRRLLLQGRHGRHVARLLLPVTPAPAGVSFAITAAGVAL